MKKIAMLLTVAFLLTGVLCSCNSVSADTSTSSLPTQQSTTESNYAGSLDTQPSNSEETAASTKPNEQSTTEPSDSGSLDTQPLIPKDPEELVRILTAMGFEPEIEKIESDEDAQNWADIFGVSTDAVEGLVFVTFYIPSEDFGPSDFMNFFYCTNVKRTLEIKAILDTESGYVIEQEGNIIAYGTEYLWDAFIDFNSN